MVVFRATCVGVALLLGGFAFGCSSPPRVGGEGRTPSSAGRSVTTATAPTGSMSAVQPAAQPIDLLQPMRVSGLARGEWTISYPNTTDPEPIVFERILKHPRGGFIALGVENDPLGKRFLLRLDDDGVPRWATRLTVRLTWTDADLTVGEDGTVAIIAHHLGRITVEDREVVEGDSSESILSLLLFDDAGRFQRVLSRKREARARSTKVCWNGGFTTTRTDLFEPGESSADGLVTVDAHGQVLRKNTRSLMPLLLAPGRSLVTISLKAGDIAQDGRTLLRTNAKGSPYVAAALNRSGAFIWAHAFSDPLVHEETALAQDERGHIFAAFRYGTSQGAADDSYAAVVYELDDNGREVRRFVYEPNAAFTKLFPAADGLTTLGWFRAVELTFQGKSIPFPPADLDHNIGPALFMRLATDGRMVASRDLPNWKLTPVTQTGIMTIADATPAGDGYLAVVGTVAARTPFAGLSVAKDELTRSFAARIRRP